MPTYMSAHPISVLLETLKEFDDRLCERYGVGLDIEQVQLLCGDDVEEIRAALDDWEARLEINVDALRAIVPWRSEEHFAELCIATTPPSQLSP